MFSVARFMRQCMQHAQKVHSTIASIAAVLSTSVSLVQCRFHILLLDGPVWADHHRASTILACTVSSMRSCVSCGA